MINGFIFDEFLAKWSEGITDDPFMGPVITLESAMENFLVKDGAIVTADDYDGVKETINMSAFVFPVIMPQIEKVMFHDPATIVYWSDGDKTVVKATEGETFNEEIGLAMAISKKYCYNMSIWKAESNPRADFKRLVKNAKRFEDD